MPQSVLYLAEANGARLLAYGAGITQVGTDYQLLLETWDEIPMGEAGEVYFRGIDLTIEYTNGFNVGITPVIDGVDQTEQVFNGAGTGTQPLQAGIAVRGARIAAKVRTISRAGDLAIDNLQAELVPIRQVP